MRNCAYCGEPFEPRRTDQVYCCHKHRTCASRARRRAAAADATMAGLLDRLRVFAPKTADTLGRFAQHYGAECAEAAIRLCLTAYTEAQAAPKRKLKASA